jgi:hypothetical protein
MTYDTPFSQSVKILKQNRIERLFGRIHRWGAECSVLFPLCLSAFVVSPAPLYSFSRICGKRMTSRIEGESVKIITVRSIPMPSPAAGGSPYSRARM